MTAQAAAPRLTPTPEGDVARFDIERIRADFPILGESVHGRPLVYLDNAATSQKPNAVIRAIADYYRYDNANIHRGVHLLSQRATDAYEGTRAAAQRFINARKTSEIVFVRGTTEAINLVAQTYGRAHVRRGDEVLITAMEHHSNIVPWQMLCEETGAKLRVAPINTRGELLRSPRTRCTVRPASAFFTENQNCWKPCPRGRAAAT